MPRNVMFAWICLLSALNIAVLIINLSSPSQGEPSKGPPAKGASAKAAATGTKYSRDPEFARAVKAIIQECTVNVDLAKVEC
jgi:hypothetical protein